MTDHSTDYTALKKLAEITQIPLPSEQEIEKAKAGGAKIVGYSPRRARQFMVGQITLGDFAGVPKDAQYEMAKVGHAYLEQGKTEPAKQVFLGLLALDPYDAYFHLALGSAYQQENALEEAEDAYSRSLKINAYSTTALTNRGEVRLLMGKLVEGADDLGRAVELDPEAKEHASKRAQALVVTVREQLDEAS